MTKNKDYIIRYMSLAPLSLAFERILECRIYDKMEFERPVLDIGCGEGLFAKILFEDKVDTGIDFNSRELERAKVVGSYDELIKCYADSIPKDDNSFNTVFSNSVLEHIQDIKPVLREAYRVLKPGGIFYFTVPSDYFEVYSVTNSILVTFGLSRASRKFRTFFNRFWKHYHCYNLEEWQLLVKEAGFVIEKSFSYDSKKTCLLNDFLTIFSIPSLFIKKITNRWILFPSFRRAVMAVIYPIAVMILDKDEKVEHGGLIFIAARKPN